jgi:hypothetical protein
MMERKELFFILHSESRATVLCTPYVLKILDLLLISAKLV